MTSNLLTILGADAPNLGLTGPDSDLFVRLYSTWQEKRRRNLLRTVYYEGKNALKDFGIAVPPQMQRAYTSLQTVAKGVHALTDRSKFEGFVTPTGVDDPFDLSTVLDDNDFKMEFPMAIKSSAIHACSFLTVSTGDVQSGEPDVLVLARSADSSGALWDNRRRAMSGFLSIIDSDESGVTEMVMYTPETVYSFSKRTKWVTSSIPNPLGEVSVARLAYMPNLSRPFGTSRITRTGMDLTDAMVRTVLRSEVSAEFYAADKYWLFGADVTKFVGDDKWSAVMGRMNAIDQEPGDSISVQRFSGASPQPHIDQLRMLTSLFAEDQSLDVKWADASNPSSADAIYAAKESLIENCDRSNDIWGYGAAKAMRFAVQLRDDLDSVPNELRSLATRFTNPAIVSPSARANAFTQLSSAIDGFGNSEVGMEYAGLSRETITRFQAEQQRAGASSRIADLVGAVQGARTDATAPQPGVDAANLVKAKADALGVLRRAGVDAEVAAKIVGLEGVKFIPGQPITIKSAAE